MARIVNNLIAPLTGVVFDIHIHGLHANLQKVVTTAIAGRFTGLNLATWYTSKKYTPQYLR